MEEEGREMAATAEGTKPGSLTPTHAPVVVDIGKKRRKQVKQLRRGKGKLVAQVQACIEELRTAGTIAASVQPVIVVVQEKRRSRRLWQI
jgi:hypothetical protein